MGRPDPASPAGARARPAKPVDRLLGVADQKERPLPVGKHLRKSCTAARRCPGTRRRAPPGICAGRIDQAARPGCRRRPGHPQQQVVEGLDIALQRAAARDRRAGAAEQLDLDLPEKVLGSAFHRPGDRPPFPAGIEHPVARGGFPLVRLGHDRARAKPVDSRDRREFDAARLEERLERVPHFPERICAGSGSPGFAAAEGDGVQAGIGKQAQGIVPFRCPESSQRRRPPAGSASRAG